jgi:hypothetical protein
MVVTWEAPLYFLMRASNPVTPAGEIALLEIARGYEDHPGAMLIVAGQRFRRGTFLPFFLALESAMAIACLRLFTLPARPPRPLLAVPRL